VWGVRVPLILRILVYRQQWRLSSYTSILGDMRLWVVFCEHLLLSWYPSQSVSCCGVGGVVRSRAGPSRPTQGHSWGYLEGQFSRDLVFFWQLMPIQWLQERPCDTPTKGLSWHLRTVRQPDRASSRVSMVLMRGYSEGLAFVGRC